MNLNKIFFMTTYALGYAVNQHHDYHLAPAYLSHIESLDHLTWLGTIYPKETPSDPIQEVQNYLNYFSDSPFVIISSDLSIIEALDPKQTTLITKEAIATTATIYQSGTIHSENLVVDFRCLPSLTLEQIQKPRCLVITHISPSQADSPKATALINHFTTNHAS